ncbi:unnamed protein product [Aphanomyces euteiches]
MTAATALVAMDDVRAYLQSDESLEAQFEEDVKRNPYSIDTWTSYLNLLHTKPQGTRLSEKRIAIYRRALGYVPLSYKLWKRFLDETFALVRGLRIDAPEYTDLKQLYEDALVHLHKMPRIWLQYVQLLEHLCLGTETRRAYDRALRALPITQHKRIWTPYLAFIHAQGVQATAIRVYRRYLMFEPTGREAYVRYLLSMEMWEEASLQLVQVLNMPQTASRHTLWMELCTLISSHPDEVSSSLNVEAILRSGVHLFSDEVGRFWCALATYYMRLGMFENARDVYEEGLAAVLTVRDFSLIFDAYVKFLEALVAAEMQNPEELTRTLQLYEDLAERRPLLLNAVFLRQNPHAVKEWQKRIALHEASPLQVVRTYTEAIKTIDPMQAVGSLSSLWVDFAKYYESHGDFNNARSVFHKAMAQTAWKSTDERATLLCAFVDFELRVEEFDAALELIRHGCTQRVLAKSLKVWSLRVDLEESLGDVDSTRAAYDRCMELKVATPQLLLQYTAYLESNSYFEEAFQVYERALALFPTFPHAKDIWTAYLTAFVRRYQGSKIERARDLFNQVLRVAPASDLAPFFKQFASLEENYGLWRNAQAIYERATNEIEESTAQLDLYRYYIKKAQENAGVVAVRAIYERAMAHLPNETVWRLGLEFCTFETAMGEIHRARGVFNHISQCCDPRVSEESFWSRWHAFELEHGNEETFLDMLRIKRSVQLQYATVNYIGSAAGALDMVPSSSNATQSSSFTPADPMQQLEAKEEEEQPEVQAESIVEAVKNDEEIDLDMVEEQPVPESVFRGKKK